tara:strand:- start:508 stop:1461 length:954 start_codon:yes stop_codon:yes gene_type:complete
MIIKEMNKIIPQFNAEIGQEFDAKSVQLKKANSMLTNAFLITLFLGAAFVDLALREKLPLGIGLTFTAVSLLLYVIKSTRNLNEQWTYTRVIAESIKSEWYKYIVGGGDYPCNDEVGEEYYKELFEKNIQEKISEYRDNILEVGGSPIEFTLEIDANTTAERDKQFAERLEVYKTRRIEDQLSWYEKKSLIMKNKEKRYRWGFALTVTAGLLVGVVKLLDWSSLGFINDSDWFSIAVALGFMLESMNSVFQHERLSITYKKSANDLRESLNKINDSDNDVKKDENVFVEFVEDVENRISNEHKSWSLTTNSKNLPNF